MKFPQNGNRQWFCSGQKNPDPLLFRICSKLLQASIFRPTEKVRSVMKKGEYPRTENPQIFCPSKKNKSPELAHHFTTKNKNPKSMYIYVTYKGHEILTFFVLINRKQRAKLNDWLRSLQCRGVVVGRREEMRSREESSVKGEELSSTTKRVYIMAVS
ncbi:hypothetical protein CsSME_00045881 [Camellia sinensis var. sinensis]